MAPIKVGDMINSYFSLPEQLSALAVFRGLSRCAHTSPAHVKGYLATVRTSLYAVTIGLGSQARYFPDYP